MCLYVYVVMLELHCQIIYKVQVLEYKNSMNQDIKRYQTLVSLHLFDTYYSSFFDLFLYT